MNPLHRWNDDRLDDLARRVDLNAKAFTELSGRLTDIIVEQARLSEKVGDVVHDVSACLTQIEEHRRESAARDVVQRRERKADRRWMVGTALTVAALIIAALGIFLG